MPEVKILNLSPNPDPAYETTGSAGFDLAVSRRVVLGPQTSALLPTGLRMVIPEGFEGQIRLRSSMYKRGIVMPNAPGTIDSDYRGEIFIAVRNMYQNNDVLFNAGDRIAQMVINEVPKTVITSVSPDEFAAYEATDRGAGGFGSTGSGMKSEGL
tara:strand:- start:1304 stop:1768 length:465 start_codon:yes stop_codon:yes gene_type:complete